MTFLGPSFGTNEKCQTSSSHVHLPSVHRSGSTMPLRGMALVWRLHNYYSVTATFWSHCALTFVLHCRNADVFLLMLGSLYVVGDIWQVYFSVLHGVCRTSVVVDTQS